MDGINEQLPMFKDEAFHNKPKKVADTTFRKMVKAIIPYGVRIKDKILASNITQMIMNPRVTIAMLFVFIVVKLNTVKKIPVICKEKWSKLKIFVEDMNKPDREGSHQSKQETFLQIKIKSFWLFYKTNIKYTLTLTFILIIASLLLKNYLFTNEIVFRDKLNNVIDNPLIFKINGQIYIPNSDLNTLTIDSKWFSDKSERSLTSNDFSRGFFEAEVYNRGLMNITFNQTKEIIMDRCINQVKCDCAALSQFGIDKNIFFIKGTDEIEGAIIMYGFSIVQRSGSTIKTVVKTKRSQTVESPSYFILDYYNENGNKVRFYSKGSIQAICIQTFQNIMDMSYYS
jgi:adenylate kinase family enzyme